MVRPKTRPGTYTKYEQIVRNYITPTLGHVALTKLTAQHVESMLADLQRRPKERQPDQLLSASTVQRVRDVLRNALSQAVEWDSYRAT